MSQGSLQPDRLPLRALTFDLTVVSGLPSCILCCPALQVVHELIERFDAHLKAEQFYSVIANMRGTSPEEVATRLVQAPGLQGLQVRGETASSGSRCMIVAAGTAQR